ncbi:hypothetical protein GCM10022410_07240 [Amphibacillus indicireducens]|uniref:Uncharacterized protein n=1 Tax=Amphibacillus indicireducens TaxID=1076330 RepID=A0ABP7VAY1_9BACI
MLSNNEKIVVLYYAKAIYFTYSSFYFRIVKYIGTSSHYFSKYSERTMTYLRGYEV